MENKKATRGSRNDVEIEIKDLSDLAFEPGLKELIIDDENIVKKYGTAFRFYITDNLDIEQYFALAEVSDDTVAISKAMSPLLLDKTGQPVESGKNRIPVVVKMAAMKVMMADLGKLMAQ